MKTIMKQLPTESPMTLCNMGIAFESKDVIANKTNNNEETIMKQLSTESPMTLCNMGIAFENKDIITNKTDNEYEEYDTIKKLLTA